VIQDVLDSGAARHAERSISSEAERGKLVLQYKVTRGIISGSCSISWRESDKQGQIVQCRGVGEEAGSVIAEFNFRKREGKELSRLVNFECTGRSVPAIERVRLAR